MDGSWAVWDFIGKEIGRFWAQGFTASRWRFIASAQPFFADSSEFKNPQFWSSLVILHFLALDFFLHPVIGLLIQEASWKYDGLLRIISGKIEGVLI